MKKYESIRELVSSIFKDDEQKPLILSYGQIDIFLSIFLRDNKRVQIIAPTQYGKSSTVACAIILRSQAKKEEWGIVAGSQPKADIIMQKVLQHTFDNTDIYTQLELDTNEPLERIKRERSRKRITWKGGGEIRTFTADSRNRQKVKEALMGYGCPNVVEDESALIEDDLHSTVMRMLGGHNGGFLLKIGNPTYKDSPNRHFYKSWNNPNYKKVFIDYKQALKEGRYSQEFIDEMRIEMSDEFFRIYYECLFPKEETIDKQGYYRLYNDLLLKNVFENLELEGDLRLGFDIGEGGDENVGILRGKNFAKIIHKSRIKDLMATVNEIKKIIDKYKLNHGNVFIDAIGIGAGVYNRLKELGYDIVPVKWSEKALGKYNETREFKNLKAENFFNSARWLKGGGRLEILDDWNELRDIKWKEDTDGTMKIKSKQEMRKEGIKSPNVADGLALTFNRSTEEEAPKIYIV